MNEPPLTIIIGNSDKMFDIVSNKLNKLDVEWERWNWASIKVLK